MILRRLALEHYGCFGSAEFEFRRGLNLICGSNESGKTLLLTALSAGLFGVEHGSRLRSWGDSLSCRVTLQFEAADGGLRMTRDLENNLVRVEECDAAGSWKESFAGMVPPNGEGANRIEYQGILARHLSLGSESLQRFLADAAYAESVFMDDGRQAATLVLEATGAAPRVAAPVAPVQDPAALKREIAELEAELAADRADYGKGEKYLSWIRKKYGLDGKKPSVSAKAPAAKGNSREQSTLERRRSELQAELRAQGLPSALPEDLPKLFESAEQLRQELAALQLELTPLQRRRQALVMPGPLWPILLTLLGVGATGGVFWLMLPWWLQVAGGSAAVMVLAWSVFMVRYNRARGVRDDLDDELQIVEHKRADALARQSALAEQFEGYGLSSTPVEMVKLQQQYQRNEELIHRYREVCAQLGGEAASTSGPAETVVEDGHLRPEDIPDAEARLAELGESIRRREARLVALLNGTALPVAAAPVAVPSVWTEQELLQAIAQGMEKLTGGRRCDVRLRDGRLQLEALPGKWAVPAACSRGTVECLTLATRLALSQMAAGVLPLPVDTLSAQLDGKRRQAVVQALERYAHDHQVLLASNDEELAKRATRERWHVVNLNPLAPQTATATEEKADAGQLHLL